MKRENENSLDEIKDFIQNKIPFFRKVGISVENIARGRIKLGIPHDPSNLNHLGAYQAGVYLTLAEASGAALLGTILDLSDVLLLTKECHLKFAEPAKSYLSYEGALDANEADGIVQQLEEKRKIDFPMNVTLLNENGRKAAEASLVYYLRAGSSAIIDSQRIMSSKMWKEGSTQ